jgi:hypothetical protein
VDVANGQPFLNQHPDHIAGGKTCGVAEDGDKALLICQSADNGNDKNGRLKKSQDPGQQLSPAHHKQNADGVQRHVNDAQKKNTDRDEQRG